MSRWPPSSAPPAFPSSPGYSSTATAPPFFIAVQFAVALLIIAKHHQNIRRLLAGTESRFGAPKKAGRMSRIVVLGSGAWGTAIALSLHRRGGHQVTLWAHSPEAAHEIADAARKHPLSPRLPHPAEIAVTGDEAAVADAEIVVSVVPSEFLRPTLARLGPIFTPARSSSAPPRASKTTPSCA